MTLACCSGVKVKSRGMVYVGDPVGDAVQAVGTPAIARTGHLRALHFSLGRVGACAFRIEVEVAALASYSLRSSASTDAASRMKPRAGRSRVRRWVFGCPVRRQPEEGSLGSFY